MREREGFSTAVAFSLPASLFFSTKLFLTLGKGYLGYEAGLGVVRSKYDVSLSPNVHSCFCLIVSMQGWVSDS